MDIQLTQSLVVFKKNYGMKIVKYRLRSYSIILFFALVSVESLGLTLSVTDIGVKRGKISDQNLAVLGRLQQSGSDNNENSFIQAMPKNKRFNGNFWFDASLAVGKKWSKLVVKTNTIGEGASTQLWRFDLRNFSTGKWERIGNNRGSKPRVWYAKDFEVRGNISRFINSAGKIRLRYRSANAKNASNIDLLQVQLKGDSEPVKPMPEDGVSCILLTDEHTQHISGIYQQEEALYEGALALSLSKENEINIDTRGLTLPTNSEAYTLSFWGRIHAEHETSYDIFEISMSRMRTIFSQALNDNRDFWYALEADITDSADGEIFEAGAWNHFTLKVSNSSGLQTFTNGRATLPYRVCASQFDAQSVSEPHPPKRTCPGAPPGQL